jgi:hypothetical protein
MKPFTLLLTIAVCAMTAATFASTARAQEAHAYLVFGTNEGEGSSPELRDFEPSLKQLFGYKFYQLVATDKGALVGQAPTSLRLSRGMTMQVVSVAVERNVRTLDVTVTKGQTTLMTSRMRMAGGAPLYIRAQERADGLMLIILVVR